MIMVYIEDGLNVPKSVTLPSVKLEIDLPTFDELSIGIPYVNITVSNSVLSARNVKITQITFKTENKTYIIDGTLTNPPINSRRILPYKRHKCYNSLLMELGALRWRKLNGYCANC